MPGWVRHRRVSHLLRFLPRPRPGGLCILALFAALQLAPALGAGADAGKLPPAPPDPAARLSQASVAAAAADAASLITVETPGRFSIRAQSSAGVALQLVDMMTGPGEVAGKAGERDGRLDLLLDRGVYRLRSLGAAGASGEAKLSIVPFHAIGAASAEALRGGEVGRELGDLQQRFYWIIVSPGAPASVEAVGRALADLRLWRNGTDLVDLRPVAATLEPAAGHPMTRLRIEGAVGPGLYLVAAYGGAPAVWADGAAENPFRLRVGAPPKLIGGWFEGVIGAFGSMRFEIAPPATYVRLELPDVAPAALSVARGRTDAATAAIARTSREPVAALTVPASGNEPAVAEVAGFAGQAFRMRALNPSDALKIDQPGPHLVALDVAGEGGGELPATALLARFAKGRGAVVASRAPRVGRGEAWRGKFNLRGPSSLIFEIAAAGPVALRSSGPGVRATLEPLLATNAPRADGETAQQWDVEAGFYLLKLDPVRDAAGVIDVTFGQPAVAPPLSPAPGRATIDFGLQNIDKGAYEQIFVNAGPSLTFGPRLRRLPADLAAAPLLIEQKASPPAGGPPAPPPVPPKRLIDKGPADKAAPKSTANPVPKPVASAPGGLAIPLRVPPGGVIAAADVSGRPIAIALSDEAASGEGRTLIATIPASDHDRRIVLSWSEAQPPARIPAIPPPASVAALAPGAPQFFDLARSESRAFRLDVAEAGLYRIETLGRLKTSTAIGTPFIPAIDAASANGAGHNALLQDFLRAGSYRVSVSAQDSDGHLGLIAHRATLHEAGSIAPGGSARTALAQGTGAAFTIEAPRAATYRLDLYALGADFPARLEDADGWPLTPPGPLATLQQPFAQGRYRLVVPPAATDAQIVVRLREIADAPPPEGHGPHPLAFDAAQSFQWREPAAGAPRAPDRWSFALEGPAHVRLDISEGMGADLVRLGDAPAPVAKIAFQRGFDGVLAPGAYGVEARAQGRNDRLDYQLTLKSSELQPGAPRLIELPATIPFAIAADRIVSLTSFGDVELIGVLKDAAGRPLERLAGGADDWNLALSRRLPAGAYQLELAAVKAPRGEAEATPDSADADASGEADSADEADADQASDEAESPAASVAAAAPEAATPPRRDRGKVELHLALPQTEPGPALGLSGAARVEGAGAHALALPALEGSGLLVVAAEASADCVLSLEREEAGGEWPVIGSDRGRAPVVAAPTVGGARPWRVSVWPVEGPAAISLAARLVDAPGQAPGSVRLAPVPIEGVNPPIAVAAVDAPAKSLLALHQAPAGLRQGSAPGRALSAAGDGVLAPQAERLWLLARGTAQAPRIEPLPPALPAIPLDLAEGEVATLAPPAAAASPGHLRIWRAQSSFGQPGLDAGAGMGVSPAGDVAGALALGGAGALRAFNAGSGPLRFSLEAIDVSAAPPIDAGPHFAATLAVSAAQPVRLGAGAKQIELNLAPGAAAFLGEGDRAVTVWSGAKALSRRLGGGWTSILFANVGAEPAPVSLAVTPAPEERPLAVGAVSKRFFGAAGSFSMRVAAEAGDRLVAAGARATFISDDGPVLRGASLSLPGPGEAILDHDAGLVAVWVENAGKSPWPATSPRALAPPQTVALEGEAMSFALPPQQPMLLNARSTAPVILALDEGGASGDPVLYPAGAELHAYVGAGGAALRVYSPQDGPLTGALELAASPLIPVGEGLGEARALAPGGAALFAFDLSRAATIGVGVRSDPDSAAVRLLDAAGASLGEGVAQLRRLEAGRYIIEARAPADGPALVVRPAVIGLSPPPAGPPPDVAQHYLELVGLKPARTP